MRLRRSDRVDNPPLPSQCRRVHSGGRRLVAGAALAVGALLVVTACAPDTRYRVLVFFLDGVPPSHKTPYVPRWLSGDRVTIEPTTGQLIPTRKVFYDHTPFREEKCNECHVDQGLGLVKTTREGLCAECHKDIPRPEDRLHGPVALNDCEVCHHYHRSEFKGVLVADAQTLCYFCHDRVDLETGVHHDSIDTDRCIDCHDAHGGRERYYLIGKAATPTDPTTEEGS